MVVSIQYMRAIAVLLVVFHHAMWKGEVYSGTPWEWYNFGIAGVDLFFIISGYIMCYTTNRRETDIYQFLKARFIRIMPLYWILSSIALVIYLLMPDKINSSGGDTSIFHSFTLLPSSSKYLIQNGWTLSYEFFFYFIFSLGLIFSTAKKYLLPAIVLIVLAILGQVFKPDNVYLAFMTSNILLEFVMGMAIFTLTQKYSLPKNMAIALCLLAIALLVYVSYGGESNNRVVDYGIPCLLFSLGLINLEQDLQKHKHNQLSKILGKIGDSSYSTYLVHPFFLVIASVILGKSSLTNFGNLFIIILAFGSILTGWICYVVLEKPITKFVKQKVTQNQNKEPAKQLISK
jgi:exopolysaccharide production protein ExoZ